MLSNFNIYSHLNITIIDTKLTIKTESKTVGNKVNEIITNIKSNNKTETVTEIEKRNVKLLLKEFRQDSGTLFILMMLLE